MKKFFVLTAVALMSVSAFAEGEGGSYGADQYFTGQPTASGNNDGASGRSLQCTGAISRLVNINGTQEVEVIDRSQEVCRPALPSNPNPTFEPSSQSGS